MTSPVLHVALAFVAMPLLAFASGLKCYKCTSDKDESCLSNPKNDITCPSKQDKGCVTTFRRNGNVVRGCTSVRMHPAGCETVHGVAERCVCHGSRCNNESAAPTIAEPDSTFRCFVCNSTGSPHTCRAHVGGSSTGHGAASAPAHVVCPAFSGCFLTTWTDTNGSTHWHRDCPWTISSFPASYAPSGCYQVMGKEVCVCRTDFCNSDRNAVMKSSNDEARPKLTSSADYPTARMMKYVAVWLAVFITL